RACGRGIGRRARPPSGPGRARISHPQRRRAGAGRPPAARAVLQSEPRRQPRAAGRRAGVAPADPSTRRTRRRGVANRRALHQGAGSSGDARSPERRQSAEGRRRKMAGDRAARAAARRANAGGRHRREVRDPQHHPAGSLERDGVPGGLESSAGSAGAGRSDSGRARRTFARRAVRCRGRRRAGDAVGRRSRGRAGVRRFWHTRELSTVAILALEAIVFTWYLWPEGGRAHPFLNGPNGLLILKYSSIYGIAAIGAAIVIISGGIDLAPGAVIALTSVVTGHLFVKSGWPLAPSV